MDAAIQDPKRELAATEMELSALNSEVRLTSRLLEFANAVQLRWHYLRYWTIPPRKLL
jgi:hypothetical protein